MKTTPPLEELHMSIEDDKEPHDHMVRSYIIRENKPYEYKCMEDSMVDHDK